MGLASEGGVKSFNSYKKRENKAVDRVRGVWRSGSYKLFCLFLHCLPPYIFFPSPLSLSFFCNLIGERAPLSISMQLHHCYVSYLSYVSRFLSIRLKGTNSYKLFLPYGAPGWYHIFIILALDITCVRINCKFKYQHCTLLIIHTGNLRVQKTSHSHRNQHVGRST